MPSERDLTTATTRIAWAIERERAKGVTLEELAAKIGCTHATLSQWATGATVVANAKSSLLAKFSMETGISLTWLLFGCGDRLDAPVGSEQVSRLVTKLIAMENGSPAAFEVVAEMINAVSGPRRDSKGP